MERLWGEVRPVPSQNVKVLRGDERLDTGGRTLEVAYTPGHASHHVSYFDRSSGVAFVGDVAGIRRTSAAAERSGETSSNGLSTGTQRGGADFVMPPTPPPDIDLELWRESEERILAWEPDTLFLTHFGPFHGARLHFQELRARLQSWSLVVQRLLADRSLDEGARQQAFIDEALLELRRNVGEREAENYGRAGRLDYSWQGLSRYWRKQAEARK
jgi:glyoxylase-like metal-dependent hydrolase (beta-lactamase superfamily II)